MAKKTVQPVILELDIRGKEKLVQLNNSFKELGKRIKLSDRELVNAARDVKNFSDATQGSENTIKGQIKALQSLREQAVIGSRGYRAITAQIEEFKFNLTGSARSIELQKRSILDLASGAELTAQQLQVAVDKLSALRNETKLDSVAFNSLGKDIEGLNERIASLAEQTKRTASENKAAVASVNATLAKYEAAAQSQAASAKRREQIVRDEILVLSEKRKVTDELIKKENQLTAALSRRRQLSVQEGAREARRRVRAGAQVYTGRVELGPVDAFEERLGDLPNTTAAFSQRLSELQDRLVNTVRGGDQYIQVALRIAQVQREASAATQGLGAALVNDLASGAAVRNQKNLREAIGQLQAEMSELNIETAEGSARYAENARQVNNLQKELDGIANSYRNVADMARRATSSQVDYRAIMLRGYAERDKPGYKTPAEIRGRQFIERIETEGQALRQVLALPAAGQTTAPGTGALMSGGARALTGQVEVTRGAPVAASFSSALAEAARSRQARLPSAAVGVAPAVGFGEQVIKKQVSALREAATAFRPYNDAIRKAREASNGSISSINNLKNALIAKRNELPATSAAFERLSKEIEDLDRKSERVSRRMSRRRMSPMQMTQAAGAAISGGIFGGPEGFLGGVGGALVGGVGGAFAGAAFGAQVGGIRRTLGEYTEYAAQIARLKIALEGIAGPQNQYNRALTAAADVTKSLNVPQDVAIRGITRLTAAVKGAGGGVADAELAFKNINAAIIATGGGAEQVEGAVTALVQIFSKGKVSAEEINQIAERLPGTFNKIAAASGRTGPELTKALQDGKVGLNDLMKFLVSLGDEYGELAGKIAGSSENAGARLQVAFDQMRVDVGNALQPIGAEFQDIFTEFIEDITPTLVAVLPKIGEFALGLAKNIDILAGAIIALGAAMIGINFNAFIAGIKGITAVATGAKFAALLLNPWVALATGIGAAVVALSRYKREAINVANAVKIGDEGSRIAAFKTLSDTSAEISLLTKKRRELKDQGKMRNIRAIDRELKKLRSDRDALKAALDRTQPAVKTDLADIKVFDELKPDDTDTDGADKGPKSRLAELKAQYDSMLRGEKGVLEIMEMRQEQAMLLARATADNNQKLTSTVNLNNISLDFAERELEIEKQLLDDLDKASRLEVESDRIQARKNAQLEYEFELAKLLLGTEGAIALEKQRAAIAEEQRSKAMSDQLFTLREQLNLVTDDERIARFRQEQEKQFGKDDPRVAEATDLFRQTVAPTFAEGLNQQIRAAEKELNNLYKVAWNVSQGIGNAVANSLTNGVTGLIEGTKNAKEVFADFLKDVGRMLAQEGAKMIATYIAIGVAKIFAGLGSATAGGGSSVETITSKYGSFGAEGAANAAKSLPPLPKANGGPVRAGQPYMVGERGPELFVPSSNGGVMRNEEMRQLMGRSPVASNAPAMNFTFETTSIGGQEFVSREQLEAAMATTRRQAAAEGAKRGMSMTFDKMQNSPRTRSRIGIS